MEAASRTCWPVSTRGRNTCPPAEPWRVDAPLGCHDAGRSNRICRRRRAHALVALLAGRGTGAESAPARGCARMWKRPHLFGGRALARSLAGRHAGKTASTGSAYARFESGRLRTLPLAKLFAAISMDGRRRDGHVGRTSATKKTTAGSCDREGRVVRIFTHKSYQFGNC